VLRVAATGPLATVQDAGRPGWAAIGVPRSGAADRAAHDLANRLVGNRPEAATVETTAGGLRLRAERAALVAVTGAPVPLTVAGRAGSLNAPVTVPAGAELVLGTPAIGLRSYVAVRGGVDVPPVLGSRSTDRLSGLGPEPLRAGALLAIGRDAGDEPVVDVAPVAPPSDRPVLRVLPGPRRDWLAAEAWTRLVSEGWTVSADSDRVGLRLTGPRLERARDDELPSEGLVPGAVQVPPDGAPVLFLADHPVTGGYPVLAVVVTADLPAAAQLRPGDELVFRPSR
jgi:biotin-dependent carboxylase-like uncharacterized protein